MLKNQNPIIHRNLIMLKNYLFQNKLMIIKHIIVTFMICFTFGMQIFRYYGSGKTSLISLQFVFMFLIFPLNPIPVRLQQLADLNYLPDVRTYLKKIIYQNVLWGPVIATIFAAAFQYLFFDEFQIFPLFTIHACLVWWFAANSITNMYKFRKVVPISKFVVIIFFSIYTLAIIFLGNEWYIKPIEFPYFKFIPIIGWLLELMLGNTKYMYVMYFGFLLSTVAYLIYLYKTIVLTTKPSIIREQLQIMADEYLKSKDFKNAFNKLGEKFSFLRTDISSKGRFAATLHYRNLCMNSKNRLLGYLDFNSLIIMAIVVIQALMQSRIGNRNDQDPVFSHIMPLIQANLMLWFYLLGRKETSARPDIYFAIIPASPQQKLNQLVRYGLMQVTIPAIVANLLLIPLIGCSPVLAILAGLITPVIYLFKYANNFTLSMFLKISPNSGYFTFVQGSYNIIIGLAIPSIIISIFMFGLSIFESFVTVMSTVNRISVAEINLVIFLILFMLYHLSVYSLFYAYFDKIYRKMTSDEIRI